MVTARGNHDSLCQKQQNQLPVVTAFGVAMCMNLKILLFLLFSCDQFGYLLGPDHQRVCIIIDSTRAIVND